MPRIGLTLIALVSCTIFLGLAAWGEGGVRNFLSEPPSVALAAVTYLYALLAMFTSANLNAGKKEDRGNRWVFGAFILIALGVGFVPAFTDRIGFWTFGGEATRWAGLLVYVVGCTLRIGPVFALGNRFSGLVAIQEGHTLATSGFYRYVRNPSYDGMILVVVGWALIFRSGVGLLLAACLLIPLISRMNSEEKLLGSQFGAEYEAYRARTWKLIPWVY
jgi:protein-S-isoprenylcysteine O-methyltransferase Ste14